VYVCTGITALKVKRIRRDPAVLLAPCTMRGRPAGPAMPGRARILGPDQIAAAERAIQANHGVLRRLYSHTLDRGQPLAYIEIGPG
jgi:PPOX class probable F420-dependent enzyme